MTLALPGRSRIARDRVSLSPTWMAAQATWIRHVVLTSARTAALTGNDPHGLFQTLTSILYLTRSLVETR